MPLGSAGSHVHRDDGQEARIHGADYRYVPDRYCFGCIERRVAELEESQKRLRETRGGELRHRAASASLRWRRPGPKDRLLHAVADLPGTEQLTVSGTARLVSALDPYQKLMNGAFRSHSAQLSLLEIIEEIGADPERFDPLNNSWRDFIIVCGFVHRNERIQDSHKAMMQALETHATFRGFLPRCVRFLHSDIAYLRARESRYDVKALLGLVSRVRANEWWILRHLFERRITDAQDLADTAAHRERILVELWQCA